MCTYRGNAEKAFFADWKIPTYDDIPLAKPSYPCECLLMYQGIFMKSTDKAGKEMRW